MKYDTPTEFFYSNYFRICYKYAIPTELKINSNSFLINFANIGK